MFVGIDDISFYASDYYLPLSKLAENNGQDLGKYEKGLGQYQMCIPSPDEDVVTLGANAAYPLITKENIKKTHTLLFATETGIDQSKSAGIYVWNLLSLNENMRVVELKQACYSATAGLQMACSLVRANPEKEVLLIASDIARYGLDTPGEPTQGCGAVAMRITANPRLLTISQAQGCYCDNVMDFWRPNYMDTAIVDGKFSTQVYLKALQHSWQNYVKDGGKEYLDHARFCYHLPFGKMGHKAHKKLAMINNLFLTHKEINKSLASSIEYNRSIGNSYSASLYISLLSLIENDKEDLSGKNIGLFSYGSGCASEFFSMQVVPEYKKYSRRKQHINMLNNRTEISYDQYKKFFNFTLPTDGKNLILPQETKGRYRLASLKNHSRIYAANEQKK